MFVMLASSDAFGCLNAGDLSAPANFCDDCNFVGERPPSEAAGPWLACSFFLFQQLGAGHVEQTTNESERVITNGKSLDSWIWDAACSIRGAQEAPKFKDFILPLIFTKRLCDVFDDELNRIAKEVGSRAKAFKLVE
jgi:hypothetical protein